MLLEYVYQWYTVVLITQVIRITVKFYFFRRIHRVIQTIPIKAK